MKGKRFLNLIAGICLVLVLAALIPGCQTQPAPTTATTTAAPAPTTAAPTSAPATTTKPATPTTTAPVTTPAKVIKLTIASYGGANYNQRLAMEYAMDLVSKRSNGVIVWNYIPGGTLFDLNNAFPGVKQGVADIGITTFGSIDKTLVGPLFNCNAPPMSFDPEKFNAKWKDKGGHYELGEAILNKTGIHFLAEPRVGWNSVVSQVPIRVLADWKGVLVRSTGAMVEPFKALGAAPVTLSLSDVYEGLQKKTITAAMASASNYIDNKLWEVARNLIDCHLYSGSLDHIMNLQSYKALDPSLQKIIDDAWWEAQQWEWKQCRDVWNVADAKNMASHGAETISITGSELALWTQTAQKPWADTLKKDFPDQFDTWYKLVKDNT